MAWDFDPLVAQLGYNVCMAANALVRSRINAEVKEKATAVLEKMGRTVSDAMGIVRTRVAKEEARPFDLKPNKLTRETMRETAEGREVHHAKETLTSNPIGLPFTLLRLEEVHLERTGTHEELFEQD